jgi:hypothetical protein
VSGGWIKRFAAAHAAMAAGLCLMVSAGVARADTIDPTDPSLIEDPLHGFCYAPTPACIDNGTITPMGTALLSQLKFGFLISPHTGTADYHIDVLIPNNVANANTFSYTLSGWTTAALTGGAPNIGPISSTIVSSTTAWTTGDLETYLNTYTAVSNTIHGITTTNSSPGNSIGAYITAKATLKYDPGATGFYVYDFDLGTQTVYDDGSGPILQLTATGSTPTSLALGSVIVGFIESGGSTKPWVTTINSGTLLEAPEPASLLLVAAGLLGLSCAGRMRRKRA